MRIWGHKTSELRLPTEDLDDASTPCLSVYLVTALCLGTSSAQAVTGNYVPDVTHDYVGLIVFYDANVDFSHRCSGSLLSDEVFLTAGHCVTLDDEGTLATSARIYFEQDAGVNYDPVLGYDPTTGYPLTGGVTSDTLYSYGFEGLEISLRPATWA